jgi:hypothetical protein
MLGGIAAVSSLTLEARVAAGAGLFAVCSQGERLAAALDSAVARGGCEIISFGVEGGLARGLAPGDWVVATGVISGRRFFPTDPAERNLPHAAWSGCVPMARPTSRRVPIRPVAAGSAAGPPADRRRRQDRWRCPAPRPADTRCGVEIPQLRRRTPRSGRRGMELSRPWIEIGLPGRGAE